MNTNEIRSISAYSSSPYKLILCEKPSVANDFAAALGCKKDKGFFRNGNTIVTYCLGHLFELAKPEKYNPAYKAWDIRHLPIIPPAFKYEQIPESKNQTKIVLSLLKQYAHDSIIIATDAGREGELIARIVLVEAGITDTSRIKRFWVSEALTKEIILTGLQKAEPLSNYDVLFREGIARQHSDWLIGINLTRYITIGSTTLFSVGRVQTAVLNAIAIRNSEISHFKPVPYCELEAILKASNGTVIKAFLINPKNRKNAFFNDREYLLKAQSFCRENLITERQSKVTQERQRPEKLLNITGLQKCAYKRFGYTPDKTLDVAQSLYEKHKCLSYPRTPSRVMGDHDVAFFRDKYKCLSQQYSHYAQYCDESLITIENKNIFNSHGLEDHHALIPLKVLPDGATTEEYNVFHIVLKSFFMVCMPDHLYNKKHILFHVGNYIFHSCVHEIIQNGFRNFSQEKADKTNDPEEVSQFEEKSCEIVKMNILQKETQPRTEFSLDTILAFMENPFNEADEKLTGLGTSATRASILKTIFNRGYIREAKKKLYVSHKGLYLLEQLKRDPDLAKITNIAQTTTWEKGLTKDPETFEQSISAYIRSCIKQSEKRVFTEQPIGSCPLCGKPLIERKKGFFCSGYGSEASCKMVIWKEVSGANISTEDIKLLLSRKPTPVKKCLSKEGKKFSASFILDPEGKVTFKFITRSKGNGQC